MEDKTSLVNLWTQKAEEDLSAAEFLINSDFSHTAIICFHCQQAAEKFIKAWLVSLNFEFVNSHDLDYLLGLIEHRNDFETKLYLLIDKLENFAVEIRYPNQKFEPTFEETKNALAAAKDIKSIILAKIK